VDESKHSKLKGVAVKKNIFVPMGHGYSEQSLHKTFGLQHNSCSRVAPARLGSEKNNVFLSIIINLRIIKQIATKVIKQKAHPHKP
jgi:hypothetical protein